MPLVVNTRTATLTGEVGVEDAEVLAAWLRTTRRPAVRLATCTHLHTAVLQALMAARPEVLEPPVEPFLARWVLPLVAPAPADGAEPAG